MRFGYPVIHSLVQLHADYEGIILLVIQASALFTLLRTDMEGNKGAYEDCPCEKGSMGSM